MSENKPATEVDALKQRVEKLTRELREYIHAEGVMVAAGLISKEKVEQAHEIVRGFTHDQA